MNVHSSLQIATCGQARREERRKFGHGTHSDIDWKATGTAMANVPIPRRHWVARHSSGFCGTSKMMFLWKKIATDRCPRCLHAVEDTTHILYVSAKTHAHSPSGFRLLQSLKYGCRNRERSQELFKSSLLSELARQRGSTEAIPVGTFHALPAVVQKQDEIGWQSLLEGRPSLEAIE
jgi:hypothetical protein